MQKITMQKITIPNLLNNIIAFQTTANFGDVKSKNLNQNLLQLINKPNCKICFVNQIHGDTIFEINAENINKITPNFLPTADAIFTNQNNIACCIMTADCLPILLFDSNAKFIAALHCGWKSLHKNIISKTLQKFFANNIFATDIFVWLGACIQQCCFEVGEDVFNAFINNNSENTNAFLPIKQNDINNKKYLANLQQLATNELLANNILPTNIFKTDDCTFCCKNDNNNNANNYKYFSYRRDKGITGRMATVIVKI